VLGILPGMIAMVQATETVKLLAGIGSALIGRLLVYDALGMEWSEFKLKKDPDCPVCGLQPTVQALIDYEGFCGFEPKADAVPDLVQLRAVDLQARIQDGGDLLLLDVRGQDEFDEARIDGSTLIPLPELETRLAELEEWRGRSIVVHCHTGGRSARACELLQRHGFSDVSNLDGGIEAWSVTVDGSVPRY
jgi:rhodanese-related sulfurtransferase